MTLTTIASQLHQMRVELQHDNDIADERDRLRDEYAADQHEDRELFERIRWGGINRNNPDNPNL